MVREERALILKSKKEFYSRIFFVLAIAIAGCDHGTSALPEDGPETVAKRFYELISAAKMEGGTTTASEAYKLVDTKTSNLNVNQFLEIIKRYPEKFDALQFWRRLYGAGGVAS